MQRYPYLAQYNDTSQYEDIILYMLEPHRGAIMYIPSDLTSGDPRLELALLDTLNPANSEIEEYTGSITFRNDADPVLAE